MGIDRRSVLIGAAAAGLAGAARIEAQSPPPTAAQARMRRLRDEMARRKMRLAYSSGTFSGPAWDWLLEQGRRSHVFMIGEEHGIAENPKLAAALFAALVPAGYGKAAVEISAPMASEVDRALTAGGLDGFRRMISDEGSRVAFFGLREEAEWLAAARAALPGGRPFLWGVDYEVGADRHLIAMLKRRAKPAAAERALAALEAASTAAWAQYHATHNPQFVFSFSGDPALVRALRDAWPRADADTRLILDTLEETLTINHEWVEGRGYDSNQRRGAWMRTSFLRHWHEDPPARRPRLMMKMGASHIIRGLSSTDIFDLGTLVPALTEAEGHRAFQLLVLAGPTSETGNFDPQAYRYVPGHREQYQDGMLPFADEAADGFTLIPTATLRPLARSNYVDTHPEFTRVIHGFDAVLVLTGSTASRDWFG